MPVCAVFADRYAVPAQASSSRGCVSRPVTTIGQGSLIYLVTSEVDAEYVAEYDEWLSSHVEQIVRLPGFMGAEIFSDATTHGTSRIRQVAYKLSGQPALDDYLTQHAPRLQSLARERFGDRVRFSRTFLEKRSHVDPTLGALARCRNCASSLSGAYCAACGQPADVHVPSAHELLHEVLEGVTHSDSRLWRTLLALLFRPGKLTVEFVAGRRVAFLPPFRLYLVMSVIFFLSASILHTGPLHTEVDSGVFGFKDKDSTECANLDVHLFDSDAWSGRFRHACEQIVRDHGTSFVHTIAATIPKAMFVFLPLIAFLHMLLYWRPRTRYVIHLLFFLHLHAFYFAVMASMVLLSALRLGLPWTAAATGVANTLLWCTVPLYTVVAIHRVFARRWLNVWLKALTLLIAYTFTLALTLGCVVVYAMFQL